MVTDKELEDSFYHWLDHYERNGYRHYADTQEEKLIELYWNIIIDRIFEDLPEMTDQENDEIYNRLTKMF